MLKPHPHPATPWQAMDGSDTQWSILVWPALPSRLFGCTSWHVAVHSLISKPRGGLVMRLTALSGWLRGMVSSKWYAASLSSRHRVQPAARRAWENEDWGRNSPHFPLALLPLHSCQKQQGIYSDSSASRVTRTASLSSASSSSSKNARQARRRWRRSSPCFLPLICCSGTTSAWSCLKRTGWADSAGSAPSRLVSTRLAGEEGGGGSGAAGKRHGMGALGFLCCTHP